jgi:hypothetical protein
MSDRTPSERIARKASANWGIVAIAIGLGFVMFVIMRGLTGQAVVTWIVASALGIVVFIVAQAVGRRRGK